MAFLEHKPVHVRQRIALVITFSVLVLLILTLILVYSRPKERDTDNKSMTKIGQFYATILENAQSYFGKKSDIIKE
ncbi:MAG TPA: hypothetical protein PLQ20_02460 [Candidatus Paceibacterota bacterium]|jgi:hypothetical protein|nr:hypothetical protein [Candidatus Paceibacterota bacterium]